MKKLLLAIVLIVGCEEEAPTEHTHTDGICVQMQDTGQDTPSRYCYEHTYKASSYNSALEDSPSMTEIYCIEYMDGYWYTSYSSCSKYCEEWCSLIISQYGVDNCADTTGASGGCYERR